MDESQISKVAAVLAEWNPLGSRADSVSDLIDLSERPSAESREISQGVVLDYDSAGNLLGIDIDNASQKVDLKKLTLSNLPGIVQTDSA